MVDLIGFATLPQEIRTQIDAVTEVWKSTLGTSLLGIYLHGSIALHAFQPASGDIDLLVVVREPIPPETRLTLGKAMIALNNHPRPLEMSAVRLCDLQSWVTPGNCVFHYSEYWTERYQKKLSDPSADCYVVDHDFPDADITSYIKLIRQCGIVLYGVTIEDIFPEISDADFWTAISADVSEYDFHSYDPRYFASNILILGRILSFRKVGRILSKYDGGLWMTENVPEHLRYLPQRAMRVWYENAEETFPDADLEALRQYLIGEILR